MMGCVWNGDELVESHEIYRSLVDNMPNGVAYCGVIFEDGKPVDIVGLMVNDAFTRLTGLKDAQGKSFSEVMPDATRLDPGLLERYARVALTGEPERFEMYSALLQGWFLVSVYSPKPEHFVIIFDVITERKKAEERKQRLRSMYHALSATNEAMLRAESPDELFPSVCRIAVEYGGMIHAWVGVPDSEGRIIPQGKHGIFADPSYRISLSTSPDLPEGQGPSGIAYRENRAVVVNDLAGDERLAPRLEQAQRDGVKSLAVYPIVRGKNPYAVFSVYSDQIGTFDHEIASLLESMVKNVGFALDNFDLEAMLHESEKRFRQLADAMPQLVWAADASGRVDYYNQRRREYLGIRRIDAETYEWKSALHPDDLDTTHRAIEDAQRTGGLYQVEHRVLLADGNYRWHITRGIPFRDESGKIERWYGTSTDIHELKTAQEALTKSEARFRTLFENAGDGIFIADASGRYVDVNARGTELLGYSRDDILQLRITDIVAEHEKARLPQHIHDLSNSVALVSEWEFVRKDGSILTGEVSSQILADGRIIGVLRDVTERRKIEEEKAQLSAQRQLALDAARMGWWHHDVASKRSSYDGRYKSIFGFGQDTPSFEDVQRRIHPDDLPAFLTKIEAATNPANPQPYENEYRIVLLDGTMRWIEAHGMVSFERHGPERRAASFVGAVTDITERKQAEERLRESEEKFRSLVEGAADAYFVHDVDGGILVVNRMACDSLGYSRDELLRMNVFDVDDTYSPERARKVWAPPGSGEPLTLMSTHRRKDGSVFPVEVRVSSANINGQKCFIALVRDISGRMETEEGLRLAAMVYQDSSEGMIIADADSKIISVNPAFERITGFPAKEVLGEHMNLLLAGSQKDRSYKSVGKTLRTKGSWKGELWGRRRNGRRFAVAATINTSFHPDGSANKRVILFSDITKRKESDELIWNQANFDALTGLPNRRLFRDRLEHEIRSTRRNRAPLALILLDLDGFKYVNDTLGHDMGDILLKEAATRLKACVREADTVARLGGDEFTVILTELHSVENAERIAQHILKSLSEPIKLTDELAYVSASIGITFYPNDAVEVDDLVRNADMAMYSAKQEGKNQYRYFTPAMQQAAARRMRIVNDMRNALPDSQIELAYQPIIELSSGRIQKAEALIRWHHPEKGVIHPIDFISAAEDSGMISSFGNWVFNEAARQAARWRNDHYPGFQISVNISPVQLRNGGLDPAAWLNQLKDIDLPAQAIVIEITEGILLDVDSKVKDQLLALRNSGMEVTLDDFGTRYLSLAHLKRLDIDYIKIDQEFVRNLTADTDDMALCEAIILMAQKLGIKVIAEGIETRSQHELLANAECDFGQGYFFSRPVSVGEFEQLLKEAPFSSQALLNI